MSDNISLSLNINAIGWDTVVQQKLTNKNTSPAMASKFYSLLGSSISIKHNIPSSAS